MPARSLQLYDPPMCCSSGVCGPSVDPELMRVVRDLRWFEKRHGIAVERFNLAQQPQAFVQNPGVLARLNEEGAESLPIVVVDGEIVATRQYPSRHELAEFLGVGDTE